MIRRRFILKAGGALVTAGSAALLDAPNVIAQPKFQWRMSTTWTPALDVLQGAAQRLARVVEETSGGRFRIEVFPGGQIMPPFACFDATSQGTIEAFMGPASYWTDKEPALEWFTTIPFGMNPQGMAAWYHQGDGLKLWEETYAAFNLVPRPGPANAPQMAGWFRKKVTTIGDYKGLKMRIGTGQGGRVYAKAGGTVVLTPAADIYSSLERLRTEFKGKVEVLQLPVPVLRDLKKLSAEVAREESERTPMARKVHASFTKFQALVSPWDHVAEGAYHQFVSG
jgi:TRAP-type mannitol/chloroaromatic compound transport system substrate-binding protein